MGLLPIPEHAWANDSIAAASQMAAQYLDLEALDRMARQAEKLQSSMSIRIPNSNDPPSTTHAENLKPKVGIIRDSAFQFYYPENIEALITAGAETVFFSPLDTETIPPIDGLYIGGGFPETHAEKLAENVTFKNNLKNLVEEGLPIYAECGGLMYLGKELILEGKSYPMVGVLPVVYGFSKKPQGHGYTIVSVERPNPYFTVGTELRGHEFHYSHVLEWGTDDPNLVFFMKRGNGIKDRRDGACYKNVLATYTHIHALGTPSWAQALVRNAMVYKKQMVKNDIK
jgi:cobyrinic acid a,c-diamide synthase